MSTKPKPIRGVVPDVTGMELKQASRALLAAGYRMLCNTAGKINRQLPEAGKGVPQVGAIVEVW
jgi:beta-lactam-binding protein with PASTA domain